MITPRQAFVAAVLAAGAVATAGAAGSANAAETLDDPRIKEEFLGPMAIEPRTGDIYTYMKVTTAGGCPGGTNSVTRIFGKGFPNYGENVIGNTEVFEFMGKVEGRMVAPLTITLDEAMSRQPQRPTLDGSYRLTFTCQEPLPTTYDMLYGYYEGYIKVENNKYTAITNPNDLPRTPTPKAGPAALALANSPQAGFDPEAEALQAAQAANTANAPAEADEGNGSAALALGTVAVILLGATGSVVLAKRRATTGAGPGGRR